MKLRTVYLLFMAAILMFLSTNTKATATEVEYTAYLMAHFGPEEKLYYAYSRDARNWTALNQGKPVWSPHFVRDPFINRVGDTFHLVHTTGWSGTSIGHWESEDLIHWEGGEIQVVEASKEKCWAPEFFFCEKEKLFYVYWASLHEGRHHAMHYLKTKGWKNITPADTAVFYNIGIHNIDLTIVEYEGVYYGFHKPGDVDDKMGNRLSVSTSLNPAEDSFGDDGHGKIVFTDETKPTEGPEVIQLIGEKRWYVYGDPFNAPLEAWETTNFITYRKIAVTTPEGAKHCSMIPITQTELDAILVRYPE